MLFHGLNKITLLSTLYESFKLKESKIDFFLLSIFVFHDVHGPVFIMYEHIFIESWMLFSLFEQLKGGLLRCSP